jgi:hypothetical protein
MQFYLEDYFMFEGASQYCMNAFSEILVKYVESEAQRPCLIINSSYYVCCKCFKSLSFQLLCVCHRIYVTDHKLECIISQLVSTNFYSSETLDSLSFCF